MYNLVVRLSSRMIVRDLSPNTEFTTIQCCPHQWHNDWFKARNIESKNRHLKPGQDKQMERHVPHRCEGETGVPHG